jgi:hypothetical protein
METKERKHDMSDKVKDRDALVSVDDRSLRTQKEYESFIKEQEKDLNNQELSKGEDND